MKLLLVFVLLSTIFVSLCRAEVFSGKATAYHLSRPSKGNCNFQKSKDIVQRRYVAMNPHQFDNLRTCGLCVRVWCNDSRCPHRNAVTAQIVDKCPECERNQLDLSNDVFHDVTGANWDIRSIQWEFTSCTNEYIESPVHFCLKDGSNSYWTAIQPVFAPHKVVGMWYGGKLAEFNAMDAYYFLVQNREKPINLQGTIQAAIIYDNGKSELYDINFNGQKCVKGKRIL